MIDDPVLVTVGQRVQDALMHLKRELSTIRAGRANPSLLEEIPVDAYGSKMKLVELGTISAPQPSLLTVQVWDASIAKEVEKAILESSLGLNPALDGTTIRVPIPPLSEERREEFIKLAHQKGEETKISLRQLRQTIRDEWKKQKESGEIPEDELFRREKLLQGLIDQSAAEIDELVRLKEADLRQI